MHLRFERVGGHFAAVCTTAVDLREPTPEVVSAIQRALDAHGVLCFRNQQAMTPEHDFKLAQCFAHDPAEAHPSASSLLYGDRGEPWPSLREMLPAPLRDGFSSTMAEHDSQRRVEVRPCGGTLVVFEAAVVPHEVTAVLAGERLALFGFFAEDRAIPAAWRDPEGEESDCGPWFHLS